jgi:hypothetical protein
MDLRELALRSIYKVAAKKAEELVCYLPKNTSITIVALSLLLAKVIAVATQGKRKMKRDIAIEAIFDFIRNQI